MKHLGPLPLAAHRRPWAAVLLAAWLCAGGASARAQAEGLAGPDEWLPLLNAQRAAGAVCGGQAMPPAPPLRWHAAVERAAAGHVEDVALLPALGHIGSDGSSVGARVWRQGYVWGGVAENVAGGLRGAAATLQLWLDSPSHCRTLMGRGYRHVAVVGRHVPESRLKTYWVMVVARPLS